MNRIRTKIILILGIAVLLPILPLSIMVYDLINQSYRIGVNPQVERALGSGVEFSRQVYNRNKSDLIAALHVIEGNMSSFVKKNGNDAQKLTLSTVLDTTFWKIIGMGVSDRSGKFFWQRTTSTDRSILFDPLWIAEFKNGQRFELIFSDRARNRFTAVKRLSLRDGAERYLILQAKIAEEYLRRADQLLQVHQMYQTLDITQHFLPRQFLYVFLLFTFLLLTVVVGIGIWFSGRITAPLDSLVKGTSEIGKGNFQFRLPELNRKDEMGMLVTHFNQMAAQLQENQERLIYLEKMAAWQQMARKLAHEIKNPLTPIQLTIQQLVDKYDDSNPEYRRLLNECFGIINEEIGSLRKLVTEFSEFGKLPELQMSRGNLNALIRDLQPLYSQRLQVNLDESLPELAFDSDRMRRVLINLIENAIQASPESEPVRIITRRLPDRIQIEVADRGSGIPPELLSKIFEPYFSTKKEGMGLGLAISRLIVEEHGGTLRVESRVNEGSRFIIELPV